MFNKFTNKSQEVIINAQVIATDSGQQYIEGLHLLMALMQQNESLVRVIFDRLKIDPELIEEMTFNEIKKLPRVKTSATNFESVQSVQGTGEVVAIFDRSQKEADRKKTPPTSEETSNAAPQQNLRTLKMNGKKMMSNKAMNMKAMVTMNSETSMKSGMMTMMNKIFPMFNLAEINFRNSLRVACF